MSREISASARLLIDVISSRLLMYPDEQLVDELDLIKKGVASIPPDVRVHFDRYFAETDDKTLLEQQEKYVAVFDLKRRCCLYLTYYLNGDTRMRGMALVGSRRRTHATVLPVTPVNSPIFCRCCSSSVRTVVTQRSQPKR